MSGTRLAGCVLASLVLAGIVTGCSNAIDTGPFGNGGASGRECLPVHHPYTVLSLGDVSFRNTGSATAVISKISLDDPHHLKIVAAYVVPITGTDLYGDWSGYPNAKEAKQAGGIQWAQRQQPPGVKVPRARGQNDTTNLVLVLKPTRKLGTAQAVDVWYEENGQQYQLRTHIAIRVEVGAVCRFADGSI